MYFFKSPNGDRVVKVREIAGTHTTIMATDARASIGRTYPQSAAPYLQKIAARGYAPITLEQYTKQRAALQGEQNYNFSPELGAAIYAQLAA